MIKKKLNVNLYTDWSMPVATSSWFSCMSELKEENIWNKHNRLKNPNWRKADQLAIYKHDRGADLGSTEKQLQLSGQKGSWTRDLRISSRAP